jgi:hypothetical protein
MSAMAVLVVLALVAGSGALLPGQASAHERRTVAGKYTFVVGFLSEPTYVEDENGVSLTVTNAQTNQPVEGLEKTLKVEVTAGSASKTFDMDVVFNKDGAYKADFIPTRAGSYSFRFFGTVEGTPVNEKFDSGPGRFDDVITKSGVEFPASVPSNGELAQQVQKIQQAQAQSPAQPRNPLAGLFPGSNQDDVQRALNRANSARNAALGFGIGGIVLGLMGIGLAWYALRTRSAAPSAPAATDNSRGKGGGPEPV